MDMRGNRIDIHGQQMAENVRKHTIHTSQAYTMESQARTTHACTHKHAHSGMQTHTMGAYAYMW